MKKTRVNKRLPVSVLVNKLMNYDVISFDIFDTLVLRNLSDPKDLFSYLTAKYDLMDFAKVRINVEKELRDEKTEKYGNHEVNIYEIYERISKYTNIDPLVGVKNEMEEEKNFCKANPYMKRVFDTLLQNGKKIIITSDMYIPHDLMEELLENCGYTGYDKLFVSCDYYKNKRNLELYEYINENYLNPDLTIIHVGDNKKTDYENSKQIGWDAYYYPQVNTKGPKLTHIGMQYSIGSYYAAIVNNYLYNGIDEKYNGENSPYYYGFVYGGFLILGYVNWIHEVAKKNNFDKILFLARDGYILKKVYDELFNDIPSEYVLWSRYASMQNAFDSNLQNYLWQYITRRKKLESLTIETVLTDMGFDCLISQLYTVDLNKEQTLSDNDIKSKLKKLIVNNIEVLREKFNAYSELGKQYYKKIICDAKKIGIVDIGWKASGAMTLKWLFKNKWNINCEVKALVAGTYNDYKRYDSVLHTNKSIESYMFGPTQNIDLLKIHSRKPALHSAVIEIFTSAPTPSFLNFFERDNIVDIKFDRPEVENYSTIEEIFRGELDFIHEYLKNCQNHPELLNISGRDAYVPVKSLITGKDFKKFRKSFRGFVYNVLVGGLDRDKDGKLESFGTIYKK